MNKLSSIKSKTDQVIDHISAWIKSGEFKIGDKLPAERELALRLNVSLLTVNKAMARLEDLGLVNRSAGRGTHIANMPSLDAIAIICDICHISGPDHSNFIDVLMESLQYSAKKSGMFPHFLIGRGRSAEDFLESLDFQSSMWNNIKGVIAMAWRPGLDEGLASRGIPMVTISSKDQGRNSVILDYKALGRIGAELMAKESGEILFVYNGVFDEIAWNNPLSSFKEEFQRRAAGLERVRFIPVQSLRHDGLAFGREFGKSDSHIFFTDENIAAGFADWMNESAYHLPATRRIISHSSGDSVLELPQDFFRLSLDVGKLCSEAVDLLASIRSTDLSSSGSESRRFFQPEITRAKI